MRCVIVWIFGLLLGHSALVEIERTGFWTHICCVDNHQPNLNSPNLTNQLWVSSLKFNAVIALTAQLNLPLIIIKWYQMLNFHKTFWDSKHAYLVLQATTLSPRSENSCSKFRNMEGECLAGLLEKCVLDKSKLSFLLGMVWRFCTLATSFRQE